MMHVRRLTKSDGRKLVLYGRAPLPESIEAPSPAGETPRAWPELRWHPLRAEWVIVSAHRQGRTYHPDAAANPLAPTLDPRRPTELPQGPWDMAVFENRFPSLVAWDDPAAPLPQDGDAWPPRAPARGVCEVVVYAQEADTSLGALPLDRIELLFEVWADRTRELGERHFIEYVMPFENRGLEVGATLAHPHGQIYAYGFLPPVVAAELAQQALHLEVTGHGLIGKVMDNERADGRRMLFDDGTSVAFVPGFARYPYEVWIGPREPLRRADDVDAPTRASLARALKTVLLRYDGLWGRPFPYVMVLHQAPTDGRPHPEAHFHLEFYPPLRAPDRLKYVAGAELGAGTFTNDSLPETRAAELRAVAIEEPAR